MICMITLRVGDDRGEQGFWIFGMAAQEPDSRRCKALKMQRAELALWQHGNISFGLGISYEDVGAWYLSVG